MEVAGIAFNKHKAEGMTSREPLDLNISSLNQIGMPRRHNPLAYTSQTGELLPDIWFPQ